MLPPSLVLIRVSGGGPARSTASSSSISRAPPEISVTPIEATGPPATNRVRRQPRRGKDALVGSFRWPDRKSVV